ncbi:MAG: protease inhibitor I42 family protein [Dehalococcoidia bacterium]|nr:protease inhibitor I42 family protein [Dehalococcoidia bacterium]
MVKIGMRVILLVLITVVILGGCAPQAKSAMVSLSYDDFQKQANIVQSVNVSSGETITVTLFSNATTGYNWNENAQISDSLVLHQVDHKYVAPGNTDGKVGVGGTEVWNFKALKAGTSTIYTEYSRPWEKGEKASWTFKLNVTVN